MSSSRASCTECSRMRQDSMKLRMDISSLQASNRALIEKQKLIEQQIKQQKLQLQQQQLNVTTPGLAEAACAEELDRVKNEYFNLRQESESLRENLRMREKQRHEVERRAVDAENWIQIKDSIIEKQRNLLKEMEANKVELQTDFDSFKSSAEQIQQELMRRNEELSSQRGDPQRPEEAALTRDETDRMSHRKGTPDSDSEENSVEGDSDLQLRQQLEKTRAELAKSETSRRASANDLAVSRRRVALKEASLKSLQAALEAEKTSAAQKENAHLLLDSENAYLRSENSSLKEETERSAATVAGLETKVAEMEAELNLKTESMAEMAAEMEALKEALQGTQEMTDFDKRLRGVSQCEADSGGANTPGGVSEPTPGDDGCSSSGPPQPGEEACLAAVTEKITRQETQIADLNALLSYRESCILKMHDEIKKMRATMEFANTEKDTLNASITILKKELAQARDEAKERKESISDVENKIEEIRQKRCREYDRRKRAETEADELYRENEELRHRVSKLETSLKQNADVPQKSRDPIISELQSMVKELRTDNEAKRSELFDTRSKLEEKLSVIEEMGTKLKTKERNVTELRNQIYTIQSSAGSHQDEVNQLRAELSRVNQEHKRAKQDLSSILASNRYLSESCNDMRSKLKDKERQISELTDKIQSFTRSALEAGSGDEPATSSTQMCNSGGAANIGQMRTATGALDSAARPDTTEVLRLQLSLEAMEAKLRELIDEKHRQAQECSEARSKVLDLELKLTAARSELTKQAAAVDSNMSQVKRLQTELNRSKSESERQADELRQLLSDRETQLSRKRRREGELMELIEKEKRRRLENGTEAAKAIVCAQCELLGREMTNVESYINQKDEEFAHLTGQLLELRQQEVLARGDLSRSKSDLQLSGGISAACVQIGDGINRGEDEASFAGELSGACRGVDAGVASGQSRLPASDDTFAEGAGPQRRSE